MQITYRRAHSGDAETAANMIEEVFAEFVGIDFNPEGCATFRDYALQQAIAERLDTPAHFAFTAILDGVLIGYIEVRDGNHISLMFVNTAHHRKGICSKLFSLALAECMDRDPELKEMTVHSSLYAFPVYSALGFTPTDCEQEKNGIKFHPMSYDTSSHIVFI